MSKELLVDLYQRVITPLEQRITRRTSQNTISNQESTPRDFVNLHNGNLNKRIKLTDNNSNENLANNHNHINLKRKTNELKACNDTIPAKKVRQRICWP